MSGVLRDCLPFWRATKPANQAVTPATAQLNSAQGALPSGKSVRSVAPGTPLAPRHSAWLTVKSFFSRQFSAVAACFSRRAPSTPLATHDIAPLNQPAAFVAVPPSMSGGLSTVPRAKAASANQIVERDTTLAANEKHAQINAASLDICTARSAGANTAADATEAGNASPVEETPAADLAVGQQVLWSSAFTPPKSAVVKEIRNQRFVAIEIQMADGLPNTCIVERTTLHPWTEAAQRAVDKAAETARREELHRPVEKTHAPPIPNVPRTRADAVAAHARHFPPEMIANLARVDANRRIGGYVKLGETDSALIKSAFGNWTGTLPDAGVLREHSRVMKTVSPGEMELINNYVLYNGRNRELREGKVNEFNRNLSALLHRVSLPLPAGMELKRNLRSFPDKDALRRLQPGTIIQSPQFDSLALPDGTYGEPTHLAGQRDHQVQLRLVTAEGVRGIYIGRTSVLQDEEEILLPENTRYAIHSVSEDSTTGEIIVEAVVLPTVQGALE